MLPRNPVSIHSSELFCCGDSLWTLHSPDQHAVGRHQVRNGSPLGKEFWIAEYLELQPALVAVKHAPDGLCRADWHRALLDDDLVALADLGDLAGAKLAVLDVGGPSGADALRLGRGVDGDEYDVGLVDLGVDVGSNLGATVGLDVGGEVVPFVGACVVGEFVGFFVGLDVGEGVVGLVVGEGVVGLVVGEAVVGLDEGELVGLVVGDGVVGEEEGDPVGFFVGEVVGFFLGLVVGPGVPEHMVSSYVAVSRSVQAVLVGSKNPISFQLGLVDCARPVHAYALTLSVRVEAWPGKASPV